MCKAVCTLLDGPREWFFIKAAWDDFSYMWYDQFDTYYLGQFLDGDPEDGGWKGGDNNPAYGVIVDDLITLSPPHSIEVINDADIVHEFEGISNGYGEMYFRLYTTHEYTGVQNIHL